MGLYKVFKWSPEELDKLKTIGPTSESFKELSKHFPTRTISAVQSMFYEIGLKKEPRLKDDAVIQPVQEDCTIYLYHILKEIQLVQQDCTTNSKNGGLLTRDIVQDVCTLITEKRWPVIKYFLVYGAATAWTIRFRLSVKRRTVYDALEQLRATGLIMAYHQIRNHDARNKRKAIVWGLHNASNDQVRDAQTLHMRLCSPKYRTAEKIGQTILEHWMAKGLREIHYHEIIREVKELKIPFGSPDIADMAAQYLHEQGIKVWR